MEIILGLPTLSRGPLLHTAIELAAPVMISASALAVWETHSGFRTFRKWNTRALDRVSALGARINIDSAGYVAMVLRGGYDWTPESYIFDLCTHPAIERFSAMDLAVEREVSHDRIGVEDRISRTINLNWRCHRLALQVGNRNRLMPVIQGERASDYIRCFDAIAGLVREGETIGVGSMCRRPTNGPEGSNAIIDELDRYLPQDVRLHLFGLKSDGAEAASRYGNRIASIDSQAYGMRARHMANERRKTQPDFSKSNLFAASVMRDWYRKQQTRLEEPRTFPIQHEIPMDEGEKAGTVLDALEILARRQILDLIEEGQLDHDQLISPRFLEDWVGELTAELPPGTRLSDPAPLLYEQLLAA